MKIAQANKRYLLAKTRFPKAREGWLIHARPARTSFQQSSQMSPITPSTPHRPDAQPRPIAGEAVLHGSGRVAQPIAARSRERATSPTVRSHAPTLVQLID